MKNRQVYFRFPELTDRATVLGQTGSGKTHFATWLLSEARFDLQPYIVIDFKLDEHIGAVARIKELDLGGKLPKEPGLYVIRPLPHQEKQIDAFLWRVWEAERTGLFFDEVNEIPRNSPAFRAILSQGRSKRIPAICGSQRPANVLRSVFSEAQYFAVFRLNDKRDQKTVQEFAPISFEWQDRPFHSIWYDVKQHVAMKVKPAPPMPEILNRLEMRLQPERKFY